MSIADDIQRLHQLHQSGALTDAEFEQAKAKLLGQLGQAEERGTFNGGLPEINYLRRSRSDRWLGGVCGGLGQFTGIESWIWRLIFALAFMLAGSGLLIYLLAWLFVPEQE